MTRNELMELSAPEAVEELTWESIEYLFQPTNMLELMLRRNFEAVKAKVDEFMLDTAPHVLPFEVRQQYEPQLSRVVEVEEFYRKLRDQHDNK